MRVVRTLRDCHTLRIEIKIVHASANMSASLLRACALRANDAANNITRVLVTTGNDRDPTATPRSEALVETLNAHGGSIHAVWASRYDRSKPMSLTKMLKEHAASAILVVDASGTHLQLAADTSAESGHADNSNNSSSSGRSGGGAEFRLHGGIGVLRLRNVLGGGNDALCQSCGIRQGDVFVDATAGQCQDALIAAAAVGESGRVIAFEASPLLWAVTSSRPVSTGDANVDRMLNERIEVRLGEAAELLRRMPDRSADVIYFDPMWQVPSKASPSFGVLRKLAHNGRLNTEAIREARRVARRAVVVMDQPGGEELERLGLPVVSSGQRKRFGVLDVSTEVDSHTHTLTQHDEKPARPARADSGHDHTDVVELLRSEGHS